MKKQLLSVFYALVDRIINDNLDYNEQFMHHYYSALLFLLRIGIKNYLGEYCWKAAEKNKIDLCLLLFRHGADIDITLSGKNKTIRNELYCTKYLDIYIKLIHEEIHKILLEATKFGHIETLKEYLDKDYFFGEGQVKIKFNFDAKYKNIHGETFFSVAKSKEIDDYLNHLKTRLTNDRVSTSATFNSIRPADQKTRMLIRDFG